MRGGAVEILPPSVFSFGCLESQREMSPLFGLVTKSSCCCVLKGRYFIRMPSFGLLERSSYAFRTQTIFANLFITVASNKNIECVRKTLEFSVGSRMLPGKNHDYEYSEEEK